MKLNKLFAAVGINKPSQAVKAAKTVTATMTKEAPKANAADAMESQGRVMVKKYVKPEMKEIKMEDPKELKAASDWDHGSSRPSHDDDWYDEPSNSGSGFGDLWN